MPGKGTDMGKALLSALLLVVIWTAGALGVAGESGVDAFEAARFEHARAFFIRELRSPNPFYKGLARLWLGEDLAQGNAEIRTAFATLVKESGGGEEGLTPQVAGAERVKWQMRNWVRVYYMFGSKGVFSPGRLEPQTERMIEELFWNYLNSEVNLNLGRAEVRYVLDIGGSENHELMRYSNVLLAAQALKDLPDYRERKTLNGEPPAAFYQAWNEYYKLYCLERARHGLLVELFSGYARYSMPELYNMRDFAADPELRRRMDLLLTALWADWAVGQLQGVRGGARGRVYQNTSVPDGGELTLGGGDVWRVMSLFMLDSGDWWKMMWHPDPIRGKPRVLATTGYRLPPVVRALAEDATRRGEYAQVSRRIAKQVAMKPEDIPVPEPGTHAYYHFSGDIPGAVSYDYCTPDYVMGAWIIDPTLKFVKGNPWKSGCLEGYPSLTAQNRYHSIQFATAPDAHVTPQCLGLGNGKTYGQQQAVQHQNAMIVQRHKFGSQVGPMRIYFAKGMKSRLSEKDGWHFLEEGGALLAVKAFSRKDGKSSCGYDWDNEFWLRPLDQDAPVVFIAGRKEAFPSMDAFEKSVIKSTSDISDGKFTLHNIGADGQAFSLSLYTELNALPEVNGKPVDLKPAKLFAGPHLESIHGSGIITVRSAAGEMVLDFNKANDNIELNKKELRP